MLAGTAVAGRRVLVLDDLDDWRGLGTALYLAERGHEVTIVTVGRRSSPAACSTAPPTCRSAALRAGRRAIASPSSSVLGWRDGVALVRSTLTGELTKLDADALVIAETPVVVTRLAGELTRAGRRRSTQVGDCVAPRRASLAFYEARELARRL